MNGIPAQYIAIGTSSGRLGYYVAIPVYNEGRIRGVTVTKTNPQDLILPQQRSDKPFLIAEANGITIVSNPPEYTFYSLQPIRITISGGIATHRPGETLESLIQRADQAMYSAKRQGRDRICRHDAC